MTLEQQIAALSAEAAPLRCLPEAEQGELGAIVDRINALRALQASGLGDALEIVEPKRGPGRPKKAAQ